MRTLRIGDRLLGDNQPCFVIAEIGVNHNGSLRIAKELIETAVDAGADAVKFQKRHLPALYQREFLENPNLGEQAFQYMIPILKEMELPENDYRRIVEYCDQKGIMFLCTPWDIPSVDFLGTLAVPAYKIASADLTNFVLLDYVCMKNKPLIVSTGMSTWEEIKRTATFLKDRKAEFIFLHCNSTYPTPFEEINLKFMEVLRSLDVLVGYSGHERGIAISTVAVALGACVIERHITLDRTMVGPDHAASLEAQGFMKMIRDIRHIELAMGSGKKYVNTMEMLNRKLLGKSLVASVDIPKGIVITKQMVTAKSPGKGISPQRISHLIGRESIRHIKEDEAFTDEDFGIDDSERRLLKNFSSVWGFKARFRDLDYLTSYEPKIVEFHFTDKDLEHVWENKSYSQELFIHAPEVFHRRMVDLCALDDEVREESLRIIQRTIDKAVELSPYFEGTPKIVIHVGGMSLDEPVKDMKRLYDNAKDCIRQLDQKGVVLLPENLPPRPWYFGGQWIQNAFIHPEEIVEFCQEMGFMICFDVCHAKLYCNLFRKDLEQYVKSVKPYIQHLHVSDAAGIDKEGLQIGEGEIDFEGFFKMVKDIHYTWVPEIWSGHENSAHGFFIAMEKLAQYVG